MKYGGALAITQLIGNNQVLGGRNDGYEGYDLNTGDVVGRLKVS